MPNWWKIVMATFGAALIAWIAYQAAWARAKATPEFPPQPVGCNDGLIYSKTCSIAPNPGAKLVSSPPTVMYIPPTPGGQPGYQSVTVTNPAGSAGSVDIAEVDLSVCTSTGWTQVGPGHPISCYEGIADYGCFPSPFPPPQPPKTLAPGESCTITVNVVSWSKTGKLTLKSPVGRVLLEILITS